MKKIISTIVLLLTLGLAWLTAQNSPISTLGTVTTPNNTASVSITSVNFVNIVAGDVKITYNAAIATATSVAVNPLLGGSITVNLLTPGVIKFGWYTQPGVTVPNGTPIFTLNFSKVAVGTTPLDFLDDDNGNACQFYGGGGAGPLNDVPTSTYWIPGSLTFQGIGNAPRTYISNVASCPGATVAVPITVTEFNNIKNVSLSLYYDFNKLTYLSTSNTSSFPGATFSANAATGLWTAGGFSSTPVSLNDNDVLFTLHFTYVGPGTANLEWYDPTPPGTLCEYTDQNNQALNDSPQILYYIDGEVYCSDTGPTGTPPAGTTGINACYINASTAPVGTPAFDANSAKAGYSDYCNLAVASATLTGTTVTGGHCGWSLTYTFTITDNCGNQLTGQTITHTGSDQTPPQLTGTFPAGQTGMNLCFAAIPAGPTTGDIAALYTDACGGTIAVSKSGTPTGNDAGWSVTYTYTVEDACGNTVDPAPTVTYSGSDQTAPVISGCPLNITTLTEVGVCNKSVTWTEPTATDNCDGALTFDTRSHAPGSIFNKGTTTVTYTFKDAAGNIATCSFDVTIEDHEDPVISGCPTDITQDTDAGICTTVVTWTEPTASDNCDGTLSFDTRSHAPGSTFNKGTTTVTYTFKDVAGNISTCSFDVIVEDNEAPVITLLGTNPVNLCLNDPYTDAGATAADNCGGDITSSIVVGGSVNTAVAGTYTITYDVTDAAGNPATQVTRTVNVVVCGAPVSGTYRLYNPPAFTPLVGVTVEFKQGGTTVYSTVTDAVGFYEFPNVVFGDYDVVSGYTGSTGGAINALDAGQVNAWGVGPQYPIEKVRFRAGDVNIPLDFINAGDASRINNYFLQGGNPTWSAPVGLWSFWRADETISVNSFTEPFLPVVTVGTSPVLQDFYGMVTGDFNLSHTLSSSKSGGSVMLNEGQTMFVAPGQDITLPVIADAGMIAGAVSLIIDYPAHLAEIQSVFHGNNPSMTMPFNIVNGQLRISWFSSNPVNIAAGETLFSIRLKIKPNAVNSDVIRLTLSANPANEIGDQNMQVIPNAGLTAGILEVFTVGIAEHIAAARVQLSSFPNPATESLTLNYTLPFEGRVTLDIYNLTGQRVMTLIAGEQPAGKHTKHIDVGEWSAGVYMMKMKVENEAKILTGQNRIVINR